MEKLLMESMDGKRYKATLPQIPQKVEELLGQQTGSVDCSIASGMQTPKMLMELSDEERHKTSTDSSSIS